MRKLLDELKQELKKAQNQADLKDVHSKFLGKKGLFKLELKKLKDLSAEEKRKKAPEIQEATKKAEDIFNNRQDEVRDELLTGRLEEEREGLGLVKPKVGHLHPISQTIKMMNELFYSMGYSVMEEREIETDEYCFQRLNVPADHPARDMQDTIYIKEPGVLLRTQTSSIEARVLEKYKPPFKVVAPGRVYRNEKVNKSNHFIFHHYQGFVVLEKASLKDLFGTFNYLFKQMYGDDVVVRFRNKYYPEVEPGVGPDMQCFKCRGKGCPLCKGVGWIEMGGAGMIHPRVLESAGIDTDKWMGFAFGLGLDRWVMARYQIDDIRTLLGGNLAYKYYQNESTL